MVDSAPSSALRGRLALRADQAAGDPGQGPAPDLLPRWYQAGLVVVTAAVVSIGGLGLVLAGLGDYHVGVAVGAGAVVAAALSAAAWPARRATPQSGRTALPAVAMCVVAVAFASWNARYAGHHVAIGRDPGIYAVTGKWIATHGNLDVHTGLEWTSKSPGVSVVYEGSYARGRDVTQFQFDHLTPVLFAEADNIGGDGLMFRVPAILGALALCAIFAAGCRLVRRPWLVLAGVVSLALSLPQINVTRDTFSEPAVELLLWAGLWLLASAYEHRRPAVALLAGAAVAGTMMSRIDAPVYLIPLPIVAALGWLVTRAGADRRRLGLVYGAFLVGAVPVAVLALIDVQDRAGHYYDDLHSQVRQLQLGVGAAVVVGVAAVLLGPALRRLLAGFLGWLNLHRREIAAVCGGLVGVGLVAAWAIRPEIMHPHTTSTPLIGGLQAREGLPVDPTRSYGEYTLVWLSWYAGPVALALAVIGAAVMVARAVRRPDPAWVVVLTTAGIGTGLYLWNPSIVPDQIWAMRRFVPAALPLIVLLAAAALAAFGDAVLSRSRPVSSRLVLGAVAVVMVAFPLARTWPVRDMQPEAGYLAAVESTCRATGPHAALLTAANDFPSQELVGALRSWCGVPVAIMTRPFTATQVEQLAAKWRSAGRTLWIVSSQAKLLAASAPGLAPRTVATALSPHELQVTLQRPPGHYAPSTAFIYAARA